MQYPYNYKVYILNSGVVTSLFISLHLLHILANKQKPNNINKHIHKRLIFKFKKMMTDENCQ